MRTDISDHYKNQLLDVLFYTLMPDARARLAREVPAAYNAWCGREVAIVTHTDGEPW